MWDALAAIGTLAAVIVSVAFRVSEGLRARRDHLDGTLDETTGGEVVHYASEDPEAAQRQLGTMDLTSIPMSVAMAFAQMLWSEPAEFDLEVFRLLLDPLATGWQGEWDDAQVDEPRAMLGDFGNLAAHAWYSAPQVAYARVFSDHSLRQLSTAGVGVAVDGR